MATIRGTNLRDVLRGTTAADRIFGLGGNDAIYGLAGNDLIFGGSGNDVIFGQAGVNRIHGNTGNDRLYGYISRDLLYGDGGNDLLVGNSGNDLLIGGAGVDKLLGGNGVDTLRGGTGADLLRGGNSNDRLFGDQQNDRLFGDSGNDILWGGAGADVLNGGAGIDTASYSTAANKVNVSLGAISYGAGDATGDRFVSIENVTGSNYNDYIAGDAGNNKLVGLNGHDVLDGGNGNDSLYGGNGNDDLIPEAGSDFVDGGAGSDTIYYSFETSPVTLLLNSVGSCTATVGADFDTVVNVENVFGSFQGDFLRPAAGGFAYGNAGDDTIYSSTALGTSEVLDGGSGFDTLDGTVGSGTDYFTIHPFQDQDTIKGFDAGAGGDQFYVNRSEFGISSLAANQVINAANNMATIAAPQFIFDTTTDLLWFDSDGTGSTAAVSVAYIDPVTTVGTIDSTDFYLTDNYYVL